VRSLAIITIAVTIAAVAALTSMPTVSMLRAQDFASIQTFQNKEHIVITITKAGANATKPSGPVIVIPPPELTNKTGGINQTEGNTGPTENQTTSEPSAPGAGNITAIEPGQNVTVIPMPPNSNITQIDNGTVIIAPPDRNITETPGNVTVIDPPPVKAPECPCKLGNITAPPTAPAGPGLPLPPPNNVSGGIPAAPPGNATTPSNSTMTNATNATK